MRTSGKVEIPAILAHYAGVEFYNYYLKGFLAAATLAIPTVTIGLFSGSGLEYLFGFTAIAALSAAIRNSSKAALWVFVGIVLVFVARLLAGDSEIARYAVLGLACISGGILRFRYLINSGVFIIIAAILTFDSVHGAGQPVLAFFAITAGGIYGALIGSFAAGGHDERNDEERIADKLMWSYVALLTLTVILANWAATAYGAPHGKWVPLTIAVLFSPRRHERISVARRRFFGTILGAGLAVLIGPYLDNEFLFWVLNFTLFAAALGALQHSSVLFLAFITPPVLLMAAQHHDLAPVAGERIALTLAGGLLVAVVTIAGSAVLDRVCGESVK